MKCMAALVSLAKPLLSPQEGGTSSTADTCVFGEGLSAVVVRVGVETGRSWILREMQCILWI